MDVQIVQSMGMDVTDREGAKIHAVTAQEYETYTQLPFIRDSVDLRLDCPKNFAEIWLVMSQSCPKISVKLYDTVYITWIFRNGHKKCV